MAETTATLGFSQQNGDGTYTQTPQNYQVNVPQKGKKAAANTQVTFVGVASQTFRVTCTGLKPNTQHFAYLLTTNVSSDCAPISNGNSNTTYALGTPLITTMGGGLIFDYQFKPQNSPYDTKYAMNQSTPIAIIPVGQQQFKVSSSDGNSYVIGSIESKPTTS